MSYLSVLLRVKTYFTARSQMWIFLPLYLLEIRHVPYIIIGLVVFLMAISSLPLTLVAGGLIDKRGARSVIIISNIFLGLLLLSLTSLTQNQVKQ